MSVSMATKPAAAVVHQPHSPMASTRRHISMPWLIPADHPTTWPSTRRPISVRRRTWRHRASVTWRSPTMTHRRWCWRGVVLATTWLVETRHVSTARPSCLTSLPSLPVVTTSARTLTSNLSPLYSSSSARPAGEHSLLLLFITINVVYRAHIRPCSKTRYWLLRTTTANLSQQKQNRFSGRRSSEKLDGGRQTRGRVRRDPSPFMGSVSPPENVWKFVQFGAFLWRNTQNLTSFP